MSENDYYDQLEVVLLELAASWLTISRLVDSWMRNSSRELPVCAKF
jgi:hypothetical protein